ncbi:MAG: hypothetical protein KDA21_12985 [Phycisphaerales bacterium]|nr:hypothetical protein [Phycisphaerales bacterium]
MKAPISIILLAGVAVSLTTAAPDGARPHGARDRGPGIGQFGPGGQASDRGPGMRERLRERVDLDGDGTVSEAERAAAREAHDARKAERIAEVMARFDVDGDGLLNAEEVAELLDRGQRGPGGPGGPGDMEFGGPERRGFGGPDGRRGPGGRMDRRGMLEHFDTDGDGTLSDAEREAARAEGKQRLDDFRGRMLEQFDTNGDGELDATEREAAHQARRAEMEARRAEILKEFDADGDGQLNKEEREAAHEAGRARHEARRALREVDTNRDRQIDATELAAAAELVKSGDPRADFNGDGVVNSQDVAFVAEHMNDTH